MSSNREAKIVLPSTYATPLERLLAMIVSSNPGINPYMLPAARDKSVAEKKISGRKQYNRINKIMPYGERRRFDRSCAICVDENPVD